MAMPHVPRRAMLCLCFCLLVNLLGCVFYASSNFRFAKRTFSFQNRDNATAPFHILLWSDKNRTHFNSTKTVGDSIEIQNEGVSKNDTAIQKKDTVATSTEVVTGPTRRIIHGPDTLKEVPEVFKNFSLSFDDLNPGLKPSINTQEVHFQKFVYTQELTTASQSGTDTEKRGTRDSLTTAVPTPRYVNPHPYTFIINENKLCSNNSKGFLVLIVVCTGLRNFEARAAIRETWGSSLHLAKLSSRMVFLVGATNDSKLQERVTEESSRFHDLIQEDFLDTYRNLSLKSVAMLKWVKTHCQNSKFVLKADDDMFINVKMLHKTLSNTPPTRTIIGRVIIGARPLRANNSKWHTSETEYSANFYPKYCSGTSYVISTDLVPDLYNATLFTELFWLEDIYITGICARKIHPKVISNLGFTFARRSPTGCAFQNAISGHKVTPTEMYSIWKQIDTKNCPQSKKPRKH